MILLSVALARTSPRMGSMASPLMAPSLPTILSPRVKGASEVKAPPSASRNLASEAGSDPENTKLAAIPRTVIETAGAGREFQVS